MTTPALPNGSRASAFPLLPLAAAALLALGLAPLPVAAQGLVLVPTSTGRPDPAVLALREMSVDVGIGRGYARVSVRQVFENRTATDQEGTWRFSLPPSGAVGDFAVWDGSVRIPGVILEKKRARAIYRELTTQKIDPGLLQQGDEDDAAPDSGTAGRRPSGGAAFSVKVAPVPAWGTKRLETCYQQEVPWVDGTGEFRLPLRPADGEPTVAGSLEVRVALLDGDPVPAPPGQGRAAGILELAWKGREATFSGRDVAFGRDLVVRFRPGRAEPLAFSAFRSPSGRLPEGLALAPWERPADVPPEKDGFFLLEAFPKPKEGGTAGPAGTAASAPGLPQPPNPSARAPVAVALLFDTSLAHRWDGLEAGWSRTLRLLDLLGPQDRVTVVPFDRAPAQAAPPLAAATPTARAAALAFLKDRPLAPGSDLARAIREGATRLAGAGEAARLVVVTDGAGPAGAAALESARAGIPLYALLTGEERPGAVVGTSAAVLHLPTAGDAEEGLFLRRLLLPQEKAAAKAGPADGKPLESSGDDPGLRDVYAVLVQPPQPGSLSGWIGRYSRPAAKVSLSPRALPGSSLAVSFPDSALEARDLPRRWARARVDHLLALIERDGEKRAWVDEIVELSRRFKFVTPYTAFLAAPRSLLRPRRIQPGDPVIRVEADPGTVRAAALLPFGRRVELVRRPGTNLWEGRFLVPDGTPDGPMTVKIVLAERSGANVVETKRLVVDGTAPTVQPDPPQRAVAGGRVRVSARADADTVFLSVRLGDGPPVPLRWEAASLRSVADVPVPDGPSGRRELFFEASDAAGNHGFARSSVEVTR